MQVPFYLHSIDEADRAELMSALDGVILTTGPRAEAFEQAFARYLGAECAVSTSSWTQGAYIALKAWGIGPGDEVLVPAMTFIASCNIVLHCGADVRFVDVDPTTGLLDPDQVAAAVTPASRVILPVHLYGQMCDMRALHAIADRHGLQILEDSAHCIEGVRDGVRPGALSRAAGFSFYASKNITCGEGGAVVTNDAELAAQLRRLRLHGMDASLVTRHGRSYRHWDMVELGYKANMSDLQAALLLHQLERIDRQWERRQQICERYEAAFERAGVEFPRVVEGSKSARHLFTVWAPRGRRDACLRELQQRGVGVAVNYRAVPLLRYYRERFGYREGQFPTAEEIGDRTISLPLYPKLTDEQADYVATTVCDVLA